MHESVNSITAWPLRRENRVVRFIGFSSYSASVMQGAAPGYDSITS
jgi:hypothetical protein